MATCGRRGGSGAKRGSAAARPAKEAKSYSHPEATSLLRPDVGTQAQFRKKKPPQRYRYDSSLSPALDWDGQNPAREQCEALIRQILDTDSIEHAKAAAEQLRALSRPFLNWAGKAERLSFDVPTLPLFVHERLSTKAILETLKAHKRDKQLSMFELFGDPQRPIHDQVLRAYEYPDNWVNRLILGDSLVVMNSLLHYESLGGQVQMIYMDPPYGVRFGSNFQPFVRKRDVKHNDDAETMSVASHTGESPLLCARAPSRPISAGLTTWRRSDGSFGWATHFATFDTLTIFRCSRCPTYGTIPSHPDSQRRSCTLSRPTHFRFNGAC